MMEWHKMIHGLKDSILLTYLFTSHLPINSKKCNQNAKKKFCETGQVDSIIYMEMERAGWVITLLIIRPFFTLL